MLQFFPEILMFKERIEDVIDYVKGLPIPRNYRKRMMMFWADEVGAKFTEADYRRADALEEHPAQDEE